jgi:hypothetical protein
LDKKHFDEHLLDDEIGVYDEIYGFRQEIIEID